MVGYGKIRCTEYVGPEIVGRLKLPVIGDPSATATVHYVANHYLFPIGPARCKSKG